MFCRALRRRGECEGQGRGHSRVEHDPQQGSKLELSHPFEMNRVVVCLAFDAFACIQGIRQGEHGVERDGAVLEWTTGHFEQCVFDLGIGDH